MKKIFIISTLLLCAVMFVRAINSSSSVENRLVGENWTFKKVSSQDTPTAEYLTFLYKASEYKFSNDHTYTCIFQEIESSGVWEISNDKLVLNKGTDKEETYTPSFPTNQRLVLQGTEKGTKVFIEFVR